MDWALLLALFLFLAIGFIFAPLGLGGGLLFVPVLHYVVGWPIDSATIIVSLTLTLFVGLSSSFEHKKEGNFPIDIIRISLLGAVPGAIVGSLFIIALGGGGETLDTLFKILASLMVAWAVYKTYLKIGKTVGGGEEATEFQKEYLVIGSSVGGLLSSILAIGAGAIYVPTNRQYGGLNNRDSIGGSLGTICVVVPIAIVTQLLFIPDSVNGRLSDVPLYWFIPSAILVTTIGARFGAIFGLRKLSSSTIEKIFFGTLVIVLLRYLVNIAEILL